MSAPAYVVRWPHQGDKPVPGYRGSGVDDLTQWLECVADGRAVFTGGVHAGHEPEDMCLGRDLDEFVHELNAVAAERDELLAALEWALPFAEKYENTFPGGPRQQLMEAKLAEVRAAIAKAEGQS